MSTSSAPTAPVPGRWLALAGMCTAAGLVWLAFADFGVAVPTISRDLGGSLTDLQWANNAFGLVTGGLVLAAGKLSDLRGRRRMLEVGLVVFGGVALGTAFVPGVDRSRATRPWRRGCCCCRPR